MSAANYRIVKDEFGYNVYQVWYDGAGLPTHYEPVQLTEYRDADELAYMLDELRQAQYRPTLEINELGGIIDAT